MLGNNQLIQAGAKIEAPNKYDKYTIDNIGVFNGDQNPDKYPSGVTPTMGQTEFGHLTGIPSETGYNRYVDWILFDFSSYGGINYYDYRHSYWGNHRLFLYLPHIQFYYKCYESVVTGELPFGAQDCDAIMWVDGVFLITSDIDTDTVTLDDYDDWTVRCDNSGFLRFDLDGLMAEKHHTNSLTYTHDCNIAIDCETGSEHTVYGILMGWVGTHRGDQTPGNFEGFDIEMKYKLRDTNIELWRVDKPIGY